MVMLYMTVLCWNGFSQVGQKLWWSSAPPLHPIPRLSLLFHHMHLAKPYLHWAREMKKKGTKGVQTSTTDCAKLPGKAKEKK
jgi:hypothetical protein